MKNQYKIEEEVRKTMESLDGLERIEGNPFLLTRIKARLEKLASSKTFQLAGVFQIAMVIILLVVNLVSINKKIETSFGEEKIIENIANEYGFQSSESYYNYYNQN